MIEDKFAGTLNPIHGFRIVVEGEVTVTELDEERLLLAAGLRDKAVDDRRLGRGDEIGAVDRVRPEGSEE